MPSLPGPGSVPGQGSLPSFSLPATYQPPQHDHTLSDRGSDGKESACNAGDLGSIPGPGRSSRDGNGNPLQYSCLENSMDRGV